MNDGASTMKNCGMGKSMIMQHRKHLLVVASATVLFGSGNAEITSDLRGAVDCMVSVLQTVPETDEVKIIVSQDRKGQNHLTVDYYYRDSSKGLQRRQFPISTDPVDGFYRVPDPAMVLYDIQHVLVEKCRVGPYVLIR